MKATSFIVSVLALVGIACNAIATPNVTAEKEVQHLLSFVSRSGCTFVRNGANYSASQASEHLASKYDQAKDKLNTSEDFIRYVASTSSMTGKPYLAKCSGKSEITSSVWLTTELARFRKQGK
ncbi:DUF5329 domain-containing protein [Leeia sp. TBRC 13508]|uniref:DUF5329 domain-containing protein n=1 Tax=Leeia speluncae TaxID=2884804 RepID=A0ABS8D351_9NEIS|nr:DUF5329 domain-containing protein [Leeia speluncae]MCB6182605.1 DUF5329 domain-containing protein [Leeia speluncae]